MTPEDLAAQASLDRALELDSEDNEAWATALLPLVAALWADLDW